MIIEYPDLSQLRQHFGRNKTIPARYELPVLRALSHYPELKDTAIEISPVKFLPVPYATTPSLLNFLRAADKYTIRLREVAEGPTEKALFRNLPEMAQVGVIGHELGHVLQYRGNTIRSLFSRFAEHRSVSLRREVERHADISAIEHGLGFELYTHAVYIRSINGYLEQRKEIDILYLHPNEILEALPKDQLHVISETLKG
jgi:hypothetical protein